MLLGADLLCWTQTLALAGIGARRWEPKLRLWTAIAGRPAHATQAGPDLALDKAGRRRRDDLSAAVGTLTAAPAPTTGTGQARRMQRTTTSSASKAGGHR